MISISTSAEEGVGSNKVKSWVLGFGPVVVPPGQTVEIEVPLRYLFRGKKLITTDDDIHRTGLRKRVFGLWAKLLYFLSIKMVDSKPGCFITALRVDGKNQFPTNTNPISSSTFLPSVLDNDLITDTGRRSVTLQVRNTKKSSRMFSASLFGDSPPSIDRTVLP